MNDSQIIAIAIIFVAAIASVMFNNSRISDLRTDVGKRIDDTNKRIDDLRESITTHIDDKFKLLDAKLDRIIEMLADHHERISKLEGNR